MLLGAAPTRGWRRCHIRIEAPRQRSSSCVAERTSAVPQPAQIDTLRARAVHYVVPGRAIVKPMTYAREDTPVGQLGGLHAADLPLKHRSLGPREIDTTISGV